MSKFLHEFYNGNLHHIFSLDALHFNHNECSNFFSHLYFQLFSSYFVLNLYFNYKKFALDDDQEIVKGSKKPHLSPWILNKQDKQRYKSLT